MVEEEEEDGTMTDRHAPEEGMVGEERTGEGSLRERGRGGGEKRGRRRGGREGKKVRRKIEKEGGVVADKGSMERVANLRVCK